jgi:hypothetical protein
MDPSQLLVSKNNYSVKDSSLQAHIPEVEGINMSNKDYAGFGKNQSWQLYLSDPSLVGILGSGGGGRRIKLMSIRKHENVKMYPLSQFTHRTIKQRRNAASFSRAGSHC